MGFKNKMKDAGAQAALRARNAAEQAKDRAADVKGQAQEKWAEERQLRAGEDHSNTAPAVSSTDLECAGGVGHASRSGVSHQRRFLGDVAPHTPDTANAEP